MRGAVVGVLVVGALAAGGWWAVNKVTSEDKFLVAMAFGIPQGGEIEMHAIASMGMTALEAPRRDEVTGKVLWKEWVDQHFDMRDASGQPVTVSFRSNTDVIPRNKVKGTPEGYLFAKLKQGVEYTFEYIPKVAEPKRYQHVFVAPAGDTPVAWLSLGAV